MRNIILTNSNLHALVDDEDFTRVTIYVNWCVKIEDDRIICVHGWHSKLKKTVKLHHLVKNDFKNAYDHKDRNPLNNQKINLRIANNSQNNINKQKLAINVTSKYKGVSYRKDMSKWRAMIWKDMKAIPLGQFRTEEAAARAYDRAAKELFGEFAILNFPTEL